MQHFFDIYCIRFFLGVLFDFLFFPSFYIFYFFSFLYRSTRVSWLFLLRYWPHQTNYGNHVKFLKKNLHFHFFSILYLVTINYWTKSINMMSYSEWQWVYKLSKQSHWDNIMQPFNHASPKHLGSTSTVIFSIEILHHYAYYAG